MKTKSILIIVMLLCFFVSCQQVKYNSIDIYTQRNKLDIEKPIDFFVTENHSKDYIMITWGYPKQTIATFEIYRSQTKSGQFERIAEEVVDTFYFDYLATPSVTYYYKIKAVTEEGGGSEFTEIKKGIRAGRGKDEYENADPSENLIALDDTQERSFYPAGDEDWFSFNTQNKSLFYFEITSNFELYPISKVDYFSAFVYSEDNFETPLTQFISFQPPRTFTVASVVEDKVILKLVHATPGGTGDYDIKLTQENETNIVANLSVSNNYAGYVRINWTRPTFTKYYEVERKENGNWETCAVSTSFLRRDMITEIITSQAVYDFSADSNVEYTYRVKAYVDEDFFFYTKDTLVGKRVMPETEPNEDNNSFEKATNIMELTYKKEDAKLLNEEEAAFYSFIPSSSMKINVKIVSSHESKGSFSLSIYDEEKSKLLYEPPREDAPINVTNFQLEQEKKYYFKVEVHTVAGKYNFIIDKNI